MNDNIQRAKAFADEVYNLLHDNSPATSPHLYYGNQILSCMHPMELFAIQMLMQPDGETRIKEEIDRLQSQLFDVKQNEQKSKEANLHTRIEILFLENKIVALQDAWNSFKANSSIEDLMQDEIKASILEKIYEAQPVPSLQKSIGFATHRFSSISDQNFSPLPPTYSLDLEILSLWQDQLNDRTIPGSSGLKVNLLRYIRTEKLAYFLQKCLKSSELWIELSTLLLYPETKRARIAFFSESLLDLLELYFLRVNSVLLENLKPHVQEISEVGSTLHTIAQISYKLQQKVSPVLVFNIDNPMKNISRLKLYKLLKNRGFQPLALLKNILSPNQIRLFNTSNDTFYLKKGMFTGSVCAKRFVKIWWQDVVERLLASMNYELDYKDMIVDTKWIAVFLPTLDPQFIQNLVNAFDNIVQEFELQIINVRMLYEFGSGRLLKISSSHSAISNSVIYMNGIAIQATGQIQYSILDRNLQNRAKKYSVQRYSYDYLGNLIFYRVLWGCLLHTNINSQDLKVLKNDYNECMKLLVPKNVYVYGYKVDPIYYFMKLRNKMLRRVAKINPELKELSKREIKFNAKFLV